MNIIQINTDDIATLHYEEIMVFMLAEGGAMGEPGAVNIITLENQCPHIYHANYCFGDFDMDKLADVFTPLQTFDCGIFGDVSGVASGWNHVYLGAGNHLLVRDNLFEQFKTAIDGKTEPEIYNCYMAVTLELLAKKGE